MKEEKGAAHKSRNNRGLIAAALLLLGLIVIGRLIAGSGGPAADSGTGVRAQTDTGVPDDAPPPTRTRAPEVTATYEPYGRLVTGINEALGESNRDRTNNRKFTGLDYREDEGSIAVTWAADDHFSNDLIVTSIQSDAAAVLRAIDESGVDYERVFLAATFALQDAAGNASESEVILASFDRATIEGIDWGSFLATEVFDLALNYQVSPALTD